MERLIGFIETREWNKAWVEYLRFSADPQSARLCLAGSHAAFGRGDSLAAKSLAEQALHLWSAEQPAKLRGQIRFHLGMVAREIGDTVVALEQFDRFLSELSTEYPELSMGEGKAHFYRALTLRQRRDLDGAETAYQSANAAFRRDGLPGLLCKGLHNLAWLYCMKGRPDDARTALEESRLLISEPADHIHQLLGEAHLAIVEGRYAGAAAQCESVFRRAERGETVTAEERAQAAWLAGTVAARQGNLQSASALADIALMYASDAKDSRLMNDAGALRREISAAGQVGA